MWSDMERNKSCDFMLMIVCKVSRGITIRLRDRIVYGCLDRKRRINISVRLGGDDLTGRIYNSIYRLLIFHIFC